MDLGEFQSHIKAEVKIFQPTFESERDELLVYYTNSRKGG